MNDATQQTTIKQNKKEGEERRARPALNLGALITYIHSLMDSQLDDLFPDRFKLFFVGSPIRKYF